MHRYDGLRVRAGTRVSQTIDSPIMIMDHFELSDAFAALFIILIFGVLFYSWSLMTLLLVLVLGFGPVIKKRNHKGIFLHWPYRHLGISLPGMINPKRRRKYSD
ncbi:MAG: hypothetical protein AB7F43_06980 [Bacteriovoracia bacterium]